MAEKNGALIWYLDHSGFAVKTSDHLFIFDYFNDRPSEKKRGLDFGTIEPDEIKDMNVLVFASHAHRDHFIPEIFEWRNSISKLHYVLSSDILTDTKIEHITTMNANETKEIRGVSIETLKSTDEGVAFLVRADGLCFYHGGDLNWWHWEGEPSGENEQMAQDYKNQIDRIKGLKIDFAFVPVDPRLEKQYLWGLDYFMRTTDTQMVFPMHFWGKYSVFDKLETDPTASDYRNKIVRISQRGESFLYENKIG